MKKILISSLFVFGVSTCYSQNVTPQQAYEQFRKHANEEFDDFRKKANEQYAAFLKHAWEQYKVLPPDFVIVSPKNLRQRV